MYHISILYLGQLLPVVTYWLWEAWGVSIGQKPAQVKRWSQIVEMVNCLLQHKFGTLSIWIRRIVASTVVETGSERYILFFPSPDLKSMKYSTCRWSADITLMFLKQNTVPGKRVHEGKSSWSILSRSSRKASGERRPVSPDASTKIRADSMAFLPIIWAFSDQSNVFPYLSSIFSCTNV